MSENGNQGKELKTKSKLKRFLCHPATIAFGLNLVIMILSLIFIGAFYEGNDEFGFDRLIYQFGEYNIPFMNYYLTLFIAKIYTLVSGVKVFSFILLISAYISLSTIIFLVLKYSHKKNRYIFAALIEFVTFYDMYVQFQWTKISAVCMLAGICLIVCYALKNRKIILPILGSLFVLWGAIIRFSNFKVGLLFIAAFWFAKIVYDSFNNKKLFFEKTLCISMAIVLFATAIAGYSINAISKNRIYNDDYMKQYKKLNSARAKMVDYPTLPYSENKEAYESIGISENDYFWITNWHFDYDGYLSLDKMEDIISVQPKTKILSLSSFKQIKNELIMSVTNTLKCRDMGGLYILFALSAIILLLYDCKKWPFIISLYGLTAAFYCYLSLTERNPYRVQFSIFIIPIVISAFLVDDNNCCLFKWLAENKKKTAAFLSALLIVFCAYQAAHIFRQNKQLRFNMYNPSLEEYITNNQNNIYFSIDPSLVYTQKSFYNPLLNTQMYNNAFSFGGWSTGLKYEKREFAKYNIKSIYKDIIDNDKAYIITFDSSDDVMLNSLMTYLREHYLDEGQDVEYKLCNTVGGRNIYQIVSVNK